MEALDDETGVLGGPAALPRTGRTDPAVRVRGPVPEHVVPHSGVVQPFDGPNRTMRPSGVRNSMASQKSHPLSGTHGLTR
jgi:hypothetical protein